MKRALPWRLAACALLLAGTARAGYVNFEVHPAHPLDLEPARGLLAVAHTDADRVLLFDVDLGLPLARGSVPVGMRPVAVRFADARTVWVANHLSDSISVVDVDGQRVLATLATGDEPYDVVFAGEPRRAFVSCSQANRIDVFETTPPYARVAQLPLAGEDPRALAVSRDGRKVYAAIFESGNATTVLAGDTVSPPNAFPPNVLRLAATPYGGQTPAPNAGSGFAPPADPANGPPPRAALIVRRAPDRRWRDSAGGDWTDWVSGPNAAQSGRSNGWDVADHDVAVIDAGSLTVSYAGGALSTVTALAENPASGALTVVGIDAQNQLRFEPNLRGRYVQVRAATLIDGALQARDLNPHLPPDGAAVAEGERRRALGDPRALAWQADGQRGYVAGMGSNNIVLLDAAGGRDAGAEPIAVGAGPAGLALDEARRRLYVWNHFEASLSSIDLDSRRELERRALFTPLPAAVRLGRPLLYDTTLTSGTGHLACASCHVDARIDRLAWDLGNPAAALQPFRGNCIPGPQGQFCSDFHPMKGPMVTQTLQDIIGKEPFHWRGDREGIEDFKPTYVALQARPETIDDGQMQRLEDFLATITYPPNPWRNEDNSLPTTVDLARAGMASPGRFDALASPLPPGNAQRGLDLFLRGNLVQIQGIPVRDSCGACHSLPTGFGANGAHFGNGGAVYIGGVPLAANAAGANKLTIMAQAQVTFETMKIPSLRNLYERTGFDMSRAGGTAGFGLLHDGAIDSLARYMAIGEFLPANNQDIADLSAFMLAFSGADLPAQPRTFPTPPPQSQDTHAAVGQGTSATSADFARAAQLEALAASPRLELVAFTAGDGRRVGWLHDAASGRYAADDGRDAAGLGALLATLAAGESATLQLLPEGNGRDVALDRDGDGVLDGIEVARGALPWDAASTALRPAQGFWYNPARSGHGFDLQFAGDVLTVAWYTYEDDGEPTWYLAAGAFADGRMSAPLLRFTRPDPAQPVRQEAAGSIELSFDEAERGMVRWQLGTQQGSEPLQRLRFGPRQRGELHTGTWYDPADSGWGLSLESAGATTAAVVYLYDRSGQPRWLLGAGDPTGAIALDSFRGFAPGQPAQPTTRVAAGSVRLARRFERAIDLVLDGQVLGQAGDPWRRNTRVLPLTSAPREPRAQ
jgi:YVTN family beta-propeller protein